MHVLALVVPDSIMGDRRKRRICIYVRMCNYYCAQFCIYGYLWVYYWV